MKMTRTTNEIRYDPQIGLAIPQRRSVRHARTALRLRLNDLLSVTIALFVLLSAAILAVSLTLKALRPKPAEAMVAGDNYADPLVLSTPARILMSSQPAPLEPTTPRLTVARAPMAAPASRSRTKTKRPTHSVALARADLYLPPLHHGVPDTFAPMDDWSAHGEFHSTANCERFRSQTIADTIAERDQEPSGDRALYDARIKLLAAARCEAEDRD